MRTAHIIRRFAFKEWGGTESVVWNMARTLQEKSNPSEIFATSAFSTAGDEVWNSIPVHRFPYRYPYFPLSKEKVQMLDRRDGDPSVSGLGKALTKGEFDILHCHTMGRMAAVVRAASKQLHVPYVMTIPGGYFDVPPAEIKKMAKPLRGVIPYGTLADGLFGRRIDALKLANGIVCVSESELQPAKERFPDKLIIYLPNGVNYEYFHDYAGTDFRKQVGIRPDRKILLCVSRIDYLKNQLILPEILALLGEPWHLVLIGAPTEEWYVEKLREKIRLMNLADRVTMIKGIAPDSSMLPAALAARTVRHRGAGGMERGNSRHRFSCRRAQDIDPRWGKRIICACGRRPRRMGLPDPETRRRCGTARPDYGKRRRRCPRTVHLGHYYGQTAGFL